MNDLILLLMSGFIALFCTFWIYPYVLKVAKTKNIVDNPDARKLQRTPVPVLGGMAVVFGIFMGMMGYSFFRGTFEFFPMFTAIIIIFIIGFLDDLISLSPKVRFLTEIVLILYLIVTSGCHLNHFHGLWGIEVIPDFVSIPLTIFSCVGIINAVNLIDGVDGYSSGYSIVSCLLFGLMCGVLDDIRMIAFALIVGVSLLPFFLCNVFGKSSKMFIGDAGTLSLGVIFSGFVLRIIATPNGDAALAHNLGLIPFTVAVMCVPIFDTLRVMTARIYHGKSPFSPDKTHLHHLFIDLGFSHIGTTLSIISLNLFVVLCWFLSTLLGATPDVQLYLVLSLGALITFWFYPFVKRQIKGDTAIYHLLHRIGSTTHMKDKRFWKTLQKMVDCAIGADE